MSAKTTVRMTVKYINGDEEHSHHKDLRYWHHSV
jgi:hypothetical protein